VQQRAFSLGLAQQRASERNKNNNNKEKKNTFGYWACVMCTYPPSDLSCVLT
jgi:hypothetical protein